MILDWQRTGPREMRSTCGRYRIDKSDGTPPTYTLYFQSAPDRWTRINWWVVAAAAQSAASEHAMKVRRDRERMETLERGGVVRE